MNRPSYGDRARSLRVGIPALVVAATAILTGTLGLLVGLMEDSSTGFVLWPLLLGLCVVTVGVLLMRALARAVFGPTRTSTRLSGSADDRPAVGNAE